jgi:transposase
MEEDQDRAAKGQMVALMQAGCSWREAARQAGIQTSHSAAYRLLQKVRAQGEAGLQDGRHGHPYKVRPPVRQWLEDRYQADADTPSHVVQQALLERFGIRGSRSHLNAVRLSLGRGSQIQPLGIKKKGKRTQIIRHSG